jgi:hypothetical protein
MFDPQTCNAYLMLAIGEARRSERLKEAEYDRLIQKVKSTQPRLLNRVLAGFGALLILAGNKLQEQYT